MPDGVRQQLLSYLGQGRSAVRVHKDDDDARRGARRKVQLAKEGLGERGTPPWWEQSQPERQQRWEGALAALADLTSESQELQERSESPETLETSESPETSESRETRESRETSESPEASGSPGAPKWPDAGIRTGPSVVELRQEILRIAAARGPEKTLCPSDAARSIGGDTWRLLMPDARRIAFELAGEGLVDVTQHGEPVSGPDVRGPIRIRLRPVHDTPS